MNGGFYGDLFIIFRVELSKDFEWDGVMIYFKLLIDFVQVVFGDEV